MAFLACIKISKDEEYEKEKGPRLTLIHQRESRQILSSGNLERKSNIGVIPLSIEADTAREFGGRRRGAGERSSEAAEAPSFGVAEEGRRGGGSHVYVDRCREGRGPDEGVGKVCREGDDLGRFGEELALVIVSREDEGPQVVERKNLHV